MDLRFHFISGLPRSGSTLLGGILRQNPKFRAGMSSPVARLFMQLLIGMGPAQGNVLFMDDTQRADILRGLFYSFFGKAPAGAVIFDTNRIWCSRMSALALLFPDSRVIACVRDLAWVLDSFERIVSRNPLWMSRMFMNESRSMPSNTVYSRIESLMAPGPGETVGFAFHALQEAFYGEHASRLILVDYEALAREPKRTIDRLYDYLRLARFPHDFDNVVYDEGEEFDVWIGLPGMHRIDGKVRYVERATILPPDLFARFSNRAFWRKPEAQRANGALILLPEHG